MAETEVAPEWRAGLGYGAGAAVVAVFCYATASRIPYLREAYWAPIAAVVVLYPDHASTWKAGIERFLGTAVGCLIGWGSAVWWHHSAAIYGAAVLLAVGLCYLLRLPTASRLCAVAVTVITIVPHPEPPHLVALFRFVEVSYGIACAMVYTAAVDRLAGRRMGRANDP
jgi:uncharacterized membrane protein YgaE (UPF0421/DUF939 family)